MTKKHPRITLYTSHGCPHCRHAKTFLQQQHVPFLEHNIQRSPKAMKQWQKLGAKTVPVLAIGDRILFGFQPQVWKKALSRIFS